MIEMTRTEFDNLPEKIDIANHKYSKANKELSDDGYCFEVEDTGEKIIITKVKVDIIGN